MIVAHIMGVPIEESVLQLAPAGAATVTLAAIAARTTLGRLRRRRPGRVASTDDTPRESRVEANCSRRSSTTGPRHEL
jgi:hypothetical protein